MTLSTAADMATTVTWATSMAAGDTATAGTDYTAGSGTPSFAAADTSKTVKVTGDAVDEGNETFTVTLSPASAGLSIGDATATGTITDDDDRGLAPPHDPVAWQRASFRGVPAGHARQQHPPNWGLVFTRAAVTVTEASETGRTATYTVALSSQPTAAVSVAVATVAVATNDATAATVLPATVNSTTSNWSDGQDGHGGALLIIIYYTVILIDRRVARWGNLRSGPWSRRATWSGFWWS